MYAPSQLTGTAAALWDAVVSMRADQLPATARALVLQLCPDRLRAARLTSAHVAMLVRRGAHCEVVVAWPVPEDPPLVLVVAAQEKKAHALCDSVAAVCLRGMARITAAAVVRLDDSWVVETRGTWPTR